MPFDGSDPQLATVAMIDALLDFFGEDGERWLRGNWQDGGRRCLRQAMRHVRATRHIRGDKTPFYIRQTMVREKVCGRRLADYNDRRKSFHELKILLLSARQLARADIEGSPRPTERFPYILCWDMPSNRAAGK